MQSVDAKKEFACFDEFCYKTGLQLMKCRCNVGWSVAFCCLFLAFLPLITRVQATGLQRISNGTLGLPGELPVYGYTLVDAYAGLSFVDPVGLASAPGETNRLFVLEQGGLVYVITNLASPNKTLFLDVRPVFNGCEGGLLGLAFHPAFQSNGFFFVCYTRYTAWPDAQGVEGVYERVSRFSVSATDPNQGLAGSEVVLFSQLDEACNHNGGDLHFGPDGYLYVALGDEGGSGGDLGNAQRIDKDFFSGILRIDVDQRPGSLAPNAHPAATTHYAIPPDNPFVGATDFNGAPVDPAQVRTEFWAVGLRNPWRFSFDADRLYAGDVGQGTAEEIDLIVKGGNYGWNYREGTFPFNGSAPAGVTLLEPLLNYEHGSGSLDGNCVTGGLVYRGARISQLYGEYIFGDWVNGHIWALHYDGTNATNFRRLTGASNPVSFGTDPANQDLLIVEYTGAIKRLTYSSEVTGTPLPATLADTGAFADLNLLTPQAGIIPYELNAPFWSDHAQKTRWFSLPDTNQFLTFNPTGNWTFPTGAVWIKHFELELTNGVAASRKRLETRFLVKTAGGIYGITYRWDDTNATLVPEEGRDEPFIIYDGSGGIIRTQRWHYPSRSECLRCHTPAGGWALGFNTPQLNRDRDYGAGAENQLRALSAAGYFNTAVGEPDTLLKMAAATNTTYPIEHRARSYLAANCAQCHQPGGTGLGTWDARFTTPLSSAGIIDGLLQEDLGDPANRVIQPGSLAHSMIHTRLAASGPQHMPPLATSELNLEAISLISNWITSMTSSTNNPPIISSIGDQTTPEDTVIVGLILSINDIETAPDNLTLTASSSNTNLLPAANISFGGNGTNRTVTISPKTNQFGSTTITLNVSDGTDSTNTVFLLTVTPVNDPPSAADDNASTEENATLQLSSATLLANDVDVDQGDTLVLTGVSSPSVESGTVNLANAVVTYVPPVNFNGTDSFNYTIQDNSGATSTAKVTVTVNPAPRFSSVQLETGGGVRIRFVGTPNKTYRVQASANLLTWSDAATITTDSAGLAETVDTQTGGVDVRFYRLVWP